MEFKEDDAKVDARMERSRAKASIESSEQGQKVEKVEQASDETDGMIRSKTGVEEEEVRMVVIPGRLVETPRAGLAARAEAG